MMAGRYSHHTQSPRDLETDNHLTLLLYTIISTPPRSSSSMAPLPTKRILQERLEVRAISLGEYGENSRPP